MVVDWHKAKIVRTEVEIEYVFSDATSVTETKALIVILPSTGRGAEDLKPIGAEMARMGFKVALPQPRGIHGSKGYSTKPTLLDFASDVAAVIEAHTEAHRAIVCGHAFGCWVARALAETRPDLVRAVVQIAAGGSSWAPSLTDDIDVAADHNQSNASRLAALARAFFYDPTAAASWLEGWYPNVIRMQRAARKATLPESWQASGSAPIFDLIAREDPFRPPSSYNDFSKPFGARVEKAFIDKASHGLPEEKPLETANAIADWLARMNLAKA